MQYHNSMMDLVCGSLIIHFLTSGKKKRKKKQKNAHPKFYDNKAGQQYYIINSYRFTSILI